MFNSTWAFRFAFDDHYCFAVLFERVELLNGGISKGSVSLGLGFHNYLLLPDEFIQSFALDTPCYIKPFSKTSSGGPGTSSLLIFNPYSSGASELIQSSLVCGSHTLRTFEVR